ncbi:threonine dehydratase, partial [Flavobacterium psychrophilum]|nr:threonine dehydratase [Flavobacterium psychrophilum]
NRESGPAVVGIELKNKKDFIKIDEQLKRRKFNYRYLNDNEDLFTHLIG